MIATEGVSYGYDGADAPVVERVNVAATSGEVLSLVGPSGTGKTTLLRLLALFERPDAGTVTAEGRDVWALRADDRLAVRQRTGMVFQDRSLFTASVARNAGYGLAVRRSWSTRLRRWLARLAGSGTVPDRVRDALETVGMASDLDRRAASLSAGEAQRVAFARALATDPDVLLLDEPFAGVNPSLEEKLLDRIHDLQAEGYTFLLVEHDMSVIMDNCERVVVMHQGSILAEGDPETVRNDERVIDAYLGGDGL